MTTNTYITRSLALALLLALGVVVPLQADDTDIYTSGNLTGTSLPNIIFTIDTSGSMDINTSSSAAIPLADKGPYDPNKTYYGYCNLDNSQYYWASGTTTSGWIDCRSTRYSIPEASFHCDDPLNTTRNGSLAAGGAGYYTATFARDSGGWTTLDRDDHTSAVECQPDNSIHGDKSAADPTLLPYPKTGGGWTDITADAIPWGSTGGTYTFYNANYINWARMDRETLVMNVFIELLTSVANSGAQVNIGLMRYDSGADGGYFLIPAQKITTTNLQTFIDTVLALRPGGYTPLSETFYEAYLYFAGKTAKYGATSTPATNPVSMYSSGTTYKSPIVDQCQKNFVVLLTDGAPTRDTGANSNIATLIGGSCGSGDGDCLDNLAGYMANNDCAIPTPTAEQNVITYTIGFGPSANGLQILKDTATAGKGKFFPATTAQDLANALGDIIGQVNSINSTYTSPAVSISAFNRNFHSDKLYFALFRPEKGPSWPGNIKAYRLSGDLYDQRGNLAVDPATDFTYDTSLDFWSDLADFPSPSGNGGAVELGGAASKQTTSRNLYTYTDSTAPNNATLSSYPLSESNAAITAAMIGDPLMSSTDRTDMLKWARGLDVKDEDGDLVTNEARKYIGDPLHTNPRVINYGPDDDDSVLFTSTNEGFLHALSVKNLGTELFAFMPKELLGNIRLRYLAPTLSSHLYGLDGPMTVWHNDLNRDGMLYDIAGLQSTGSVNEHAYLYLGMRRGNSPDSPYYIDSTHNSYYAFNVTAPTNPKLMWQITGGSSSTSTTGFAELAQTWSPLRKAVIKIGNTERNVLIFGGGYDNVSQDTSGAGVTHTADTAGRAIYIIDATTGAKIWQAGPAGTAPERASNNPDLVLSDMTNSFPSEIVAFDTNRDDLVDRMYAADVGGQVWRFDINNGETDMSKLVTGGVIARLYGAADTDNRHFYQAPAVALTRSRSHLAIAIGSGQRAEPLDTTVHDAFFVIKDPYIYEPAKDGSGLPNYKYVDTNGDNIGDEVITCCDTVASTGAPHLFDATSGILGAKSGDTLYDGTNVAQADIDTAKQDLADAHGWYIWLQDINTLTHAASFIGEKTTAEANIIRNTVSFGTYTPVETASSSVCAPNQGRGLVYTVDLINGNAVYDTNGDDKVNTSTDMGTDSHSDRVRQSVQGMPGKVTNIITDSGWSTCIGLKCYPDDSITPDKLRWSQD